MKVHWKHRKAETEVESLLEAVRRIDKTLLDVFPRPLEDLLCAVFPTAFESMNDLSLASVAQTLETVYGVANTARLGPDSAKLAGYTYARGSNAVIFSDPQFGVGFERFTIAHEIGHLVLEYLPVLERARQPLLFGGEERLTLYARRDPLANLTMGLDKRSETQTRGIFGLDPRKEWLREAVANLFAAELLAPYREVFTLVGQLTPEIDSIVAISAHFGISHQAARVRLTDLGLISDQPTSPSLF